MTRTYTFAQSMEMLNCDPKTFRDWLKKAGINPELQKSKADSRIRYLTQEQLEQLAKDHGRDLRQIVQRQAESIPPEAYKLLMDRVEALEKRSTTHNDQIDLLGDRVDDLAETAEINERHNGSTIRELAANMDILTKQLAETQEQQRSQAEELEAIIRAQAERITALSEQLATLKPKSARRPATPKESPDLPAGSISARSFAEAHNISRDRIEGMIKRGEIATTPTPLGSRTQHQFTPEQQAQVIVFWDQEHIKYQRCQDCPHTPI